MSIKNLDDSFAVSGIGWKLKGIRELGFNERGAFVVDAWTTDAPGPRGTFFTSLPISPRDYRAVHPTKCGYRIINSKKLAIYDDWSKVTYIQAYKAIINTLVRECQENDIPERKEL